MADLTPIHHVQIAMPAGGEPAARRFYGELIGLREVEKPANLKARGGVWFDTGSIPLHIGVEANFRPALKAHVAYQVRDLAAVRQRLVAAGLTIVEDEPLPGYDRCYIADPFGNRVELLEPARAARTLHFEAMQTNTVYFVRHGQNPANITREFSYKIVDYPLTDLGVTQAEQTAAYFAGLPIDAIFSSPLRRALQTAQIIGAVTGHQIGVVEQFREINCGSFDGAPPTDALWAQHDDILRRWQAGEHDLSFPEGENYHTLVARARSGLEQVTAGQDGKHIVVVTHGGIVGATIKDVCRDVDLDLVWRVPNANCAITEIEVQAASGELVGALKRWASSDHLSE